jgi:hypothetical protein
MKKFVKDKDGLWFNERLEIEMERRKNFVLSRSKNKEGKTKSKIIRKSYDNHMETINENEIKDILYGDIDDQIRLVFKVGDYCRISIDKPIFSFFNSVSSTLGKKNILATGMSNNKPSNFLYTSASRAMIPPTNDMGIDANANGKNNFHLKCPPL